MPISVVFLTPEQIASRQIAKTKQAKDSTSIEDRLLEIEKELQRRDKRRRCRKECHFISFELGGIRYLFTGLGKLIYKLDIESDATKTHRKVRAFARDYFLALPLQKRNGGYLFN